MSEERDTLRQRLADARKEHTTLLRLLTHAREGLLNIQERVSAYPLLEDMPLPLKQHEVAARSKVALLEAEIARLEAEIAQLREEIEQLDVATRKTWPQFMIEIDENIDQISIEKRQEVIATLAELLNLPPDHIRILRLVER